MKRRILITLEISLGLLLIALIIFGVRYSQNNLNVSNKLAVETSNPENNIVNNGEEDSETTTEKVIITVEEENVNEADTQDTETEADSYVSMVFTGDILFTGYLLGQYDNQGITGIISDELVNEMTTADITMVNEEFPFSNAGTAAEDKQYTFRIDPDRVGIFNELGIDIVSLANNHTLDYGQEALIDTFETLDTAGIIYAGAGNNLSEARQLKEFTINDKKVGVLAASRVIPVASWAAGTSAGVYTTYDPTNLISDIQTADSQCDFVVVYVHWGIEKNNTPEDYQRELAKQYIDAGADLVIGSHPHVLQGFEYYNGVPIIYSLGNYIFGSQIDKTVLLKAKLDNDNELSLSILPCKTNSSYILNIADNTSEIYDYLTDISYDVEIDDAGNISPLTTE